MQMIPGNNDIAQTRSQTKKRRRQTFPRLFRSIPLLFLLLVLLFFPESFVLFAESFVLTRMALRENNNRVLSKSAMHILKRHIIIVMSFWSSFSSLSALYRNCPRIRLAFWICADLPLSSSKYCCFLSKFLCSCYCCCSFSIIQGNSIWNYEAKA